jgi:Beta2-adaptin appendage, C-terminal sub-domain
VDQSLLSRVWSEVAGTPENLLTIPSMSPQVSNAHSMITRLQDNNVFFMNQGVNDQGQDALYVFCQPEGGRPEEAVVGEISISMAGGGITLQARSFAGYMPSLFL